MIDAFAKHGIDHLSPSSLRLFREAPAAFIGRYLLKVTDESGPGAWRGLAVEAAVDRLLFTRDEEAANQAMHVEWDNCAQGVIDDAAQKEYDALPSFLIQAALAFDGKAPPFQRQSKVSLEIPGIPIPLIGYADWIWKEPDHGTDLKTTWRIPSEPDPSHIEQVAVYSRFHSDIPFTLTYVSPKRWVRYDVLPSMNAEAWERVVETAHALQALLSKCDDAADALSCFSPDFKSFWYRPLMVEAIKQAKAQRRLL
jgi:hypothetical protein